MDETAAHADRVGTWDSSTGSVDWESGSSSASRSKMILGKFDNDVYDIIEDLADLLISKHHDYGPKNISMSPGGPLNGLRVRIWDKIARINNLIDAGFSPSHESLEDSFKDLANYSIIALMVLDGKWPGVSDD